MSPLIRLSRTLLIAALICSAWVAPLANADVKFRASFGVGGWAGRFSQSNTAQTVYVANPIAMSLGLSFGIKVGFLFIEYPLT